MKKILFSALAAMSLAACVQEAVVETPQGEAIAFENAFVDNATRATATTTNNLDAFKVWGFINNTSGVVFDGTTVTKGTDANHTTTGWYYGGVKYWVPGQDYYFAALAPLEDGAVANSVVTPVTGDPAKLGLGTVQFTNDLGDVDLVYAKDYVRSGVTNDPVAFTFQHLLSKVQFSFTYDMKETYLSAKVRDVKMVAPAGATIDLATSAPAWADHDGTVALEFGATGSFVELFTIPTTDAYNYAISFTVDIYQTGTTDPIYTVNKTAAVETVLAMGHAYNFTAAITPETLSFDTIEFTVTDVEGWTTTQNPETSLPVGDLI